mmetsp:Transcript_5177/g.15562  ORF Transcript_5177/g.15562 Transcript_5177/m.15562 type:complete len:250 (+) Transcript_5177:376-1125(+)
MVPHFGRGSGILLVPVLLLLQSRHDQSRSARHRVRHEGGPLQLVPTTQSKVAKTPHRVDVGLGQSASVGLGKRRNLLRKLICGTPDAGNEALVQVSDVLQGHTCPVPHVLLQHVLFDRIEEPKAVIIFGPLISVYLPSLRGGNTKTRVNKVVVGPVSHVPNSVTTGANRAFAIHPALVQLALQLHLCETGSSVKHDGAVVRRREHPVHSRVHVHHREGLHRIVDSKQQPGLGLAKRGWATVFLLQLESA